ncbi:MAG: hypothetical protein KF902_05925 [Phycisphaeraceae bacterium]|nr:hypothetical protein [Phycisphaeraceae bacterium]
MAVSFPGQEVVGMQQYPNHGDDRNQGWCVYCGGLDETRDHVPSRVLLDEPLPENLPVVPACGKCNSSFSRDEEYLACLVECALTGSLATASNRARVGSILERSAGLAARLEAARYESGGQAGFSAETDRARNVLVKLARGHAAFEENEPQLGEPASVSFAPFTALSEQQRARFESATDPRGFWPEVGSRAMHRAVLGEIGPAGWVEVQANRYRYRVHPGGRTVHIVIAEYLAAEVMWE